MKKVTFQEWEKAIREARGYVKNYSKTRWKIAAIAVRVCDGAKGGRKAKDVFSIHKFAEAIELNPKTLYQWIQIKNNVVDKLPAVEIKSKKCLFSDLADVCLKVSSDSSKKEVLKQWREQQNIPLETRKFIKYGQHLNALLYNAQRPSHLMLIESHLITELASKSSLIGRLLVKELELRKKFSLEKRLIKNKTSRHLAIEEALGKRGVQIERDHD